ncbi:hypothetical protein ACRQ5Q_10230 [Bradyrhizobium sp. PMVTL-01]|uniref:hypothetical protein n=1 Tax=Bradyrhizobium sp. PMVTL-01 TaxID=3434999 RepID=UPI003F6EF9A6
MPGFIKVFVGRCALSRGNIWGSDFLDLVEEAHLTFQGKSDGRSLWAQGFPDVRYGTRDVSACAEFSHGYGATRMIHLAVSDWI